MAVRSPHGRCPSTTTHSRPGRLEHTVRRKLTDEQIAATPLPRGQVYKGHHRTECGSIVLHVRCSQNHRIFKSRANAQLPCPKCKAMKPAEKRATIESLAEQNKYLRQAMRQPEHILERRIINLMQQVRLLTNRLQYAEEFIPTDDPYFLDGQFLHSIENGLLARQTNGESVLNDINLTGL